MTENEKSPFAEIAKGPFSVSYFSVAEKVTAGTLRAARVVFFGSAAFFTGVLAAAFGAALAAVVFAAAAFGA
ncbi:hypothetical protein, partial [Amycolatopsis thailandensis]|uniref:hypothetical protein n=1 Tax=Amycolatopsis thailandensis TaxID=589330 RepID=UPI00363BC26C